ncbi:uncharacterized protein LOC110109174 isoform X1 [Dendrobium catenatum]|uniref:uncharacterized protein LOC110109174 isoform X1 n=1 Tax=Dendrobium catenatum TaxID=906689 RepID=UPI0009F2DBD6|nr:uncharacterized protein LOC110109174 isoform X1 [Dendrobium catenatum]
MEEEDDKKKVVKKAYPQAEEEDNDSDDCYEIDPIDFTTKLEFSSADDSSVAIVAHKGHVALRDFPHPRHLCGNFPFCRTTHETFCSKCFCYVCEVAAPCSEWWGKNGHCNVSQKELEGRLQKFTLDHDQGRIFDLVEQLATIPAFQIYEFLETIPTISILPTAGNNTGKSTSSASAGGRLRRRDFVRRANRAARGSVRSST